MSVYGGPEVVNSGLVLCLDAANPKSYPGSGTTWTDMSGLGNHGTLTNGPTYDANNAGSIVFDSVDDLVLVNSSLSIPYGSSARSVSVWFFTNSTTWVDNVNTLFFYGAGSTGQAFGIDMQSFPTMEVFTWGRDIVFSTTFAQTGWKNIFVTYDGSTTILIYENSVFTRTLSLSAACSTPNSSVYIGAINPSALAGGYYDGKISNVSIYNRALSAAEVQQNFNALRGRYGI